MGVGGWREVQKGTYVYLWPIRVDVWQKPIEYCEAFLNNKVLMQENHMKGLLTEIFEQGSYVTHQPQKFQTGWKHVYSHQQACPFLRHL